MPVQMTRKEYESKYGAQPVVRMTRAEYQAKYGTKKVVTQPQTKTPNILEGPTFKASQGGFETIIPNVAKTIGNIPSSAARLGRAVLSPVNPFDYESPLNIGGNIARGAQAATDIFKNRGVGQGLKDIGAGFAETVGNIGKGAVDIAKGVVQRPGEAAEAVARTGIEDPLLLPTLLGPRGISKVGGLGSKPLVPAGEALQRSAAASTEKAQRATVTELVMPKRTPKVKREQVSRSTETGSGPFIKTEVMPTRSEVASIEAVMKIPGVSDKSYQRNYNIIRDYNISKAQQLEAEVAANDFIVPRREVVSKMNKAKRDLIQSPVIVGDAQTTAERLIAGALSILEKSPGTGSGLLKARKEYDAWVLSQKPKAFDAATENAFTLANRAIRDVFNETLETNAKNVSVKQSFREQSALYRALDNIEVKAAEEADTYFGRFYQKLERALGTRNKFVQTLAAAAGLGVFGASVVFAKPLTAATVAGWVIYRGGKLVLNPKVREVLGNILASEGGRIPIPERTFIEKLLAPGAVIEDLIQQNSDPLLPSREG